MARAEHRLNLALMAAALGLAVSVPAGAWAGDPATGAVKQQTLAAVAATGVADAWAVGSQFKDPYGVVKSLVEHWDGAAWSVVRSPNVMHVRVNTLDGVSAASPDDVWAVGKAYSDTTGAIPTIVHWGGERWRNVDKVRLGLRGRPSSLSGIAALAADDAWAVGTVADNGGTVIRTLIAHWDGSTWRRVPSPNPGHADSSWLTAVSAAGPDDVWAVGHTGYRGVVDATLVEHWNGQSWQVVSSPTYQGDTDLLGVVAVSAADVWAVGSFYADGRQHTLTEHWNGSRWRRVANPDRAAEFRSVAATSGNDVWATGSSGGAQPFIEHWDGDRWQVVEGQAPPDGGATELESVAAVTPGFALAVGEAFEADTGYRTLAERWDGDTWSIAP